MASALFSVSLVLSCFAKHGSDRLFLLEYRGKAGRKWVTTDCFDKGEVTDVTERSRTIVSMSNRIILRPASFATGVRTRFFSFVDWFATLYSVICKLLLSRVAVSVALATFVFCYIVVWVGFGHCKHIAINCPVDIAEELCLFWLSTHSHGLLLDLCNGYVPVLKWYAIFVAIWFSLLATLRLSFLNRLSNSGA